MNLCVLISLFMINNIIFRHFDEIFRAFCFQQSYIEPCVKFIFIQIPCVMTLFLLLNGEFKSIIQTPSMRQWAHCFKGETNYTRNARSHTHTQRKSWHQMFALCHSLTWLKREMEKLKENIILFRRGGIMCEQFPVTWRFIFFISLLWKCSKRQMRW